MKTKVSIFYISIILLCNSTMMHGMDEKSDTEEAIRITMRIKQTNNTFFSVGNDAIIKTATQLDLLKNDDAPFFLDLQSPSSSKYNATTDAKQIVAAINQIGGIPLKYIFDKSNQFISTKYINLTIQGKKVMIWLESNLQQEVLNCQKDNFTSFSFPNESNYSIAIASGFITKDGDKFIHGPKSPFYNKPNDTNPTKKSTRQKPNNNKTTHQNNSKKSVDANNKSTLDAVFSWITLHYKILGLSTVGGIFLFYCLFKLKR